MIKNSLKYSNYNYFNKVKNIIFDPLGKNILNETQWIELNQNWGNAKFPILISGVGEPILFLLSLIHI